MMAAALLFTGIMCDRLLFVFLHVLFFTFTRFVFYIQSFPICIYLVNVLLKVGVITKG